MRGVRASLLLAVVLLAAPLAGCLGNDDDGSGSAESIKKNQIKESDLNPPSDAEVASLETGYRFSWEDVELPFRKEVQLPPGATMVNASAELSDDGGAWVNVTNAATGMARCAPQRLSGFDDAVPGAANCAAMTAIDTLPTTWMLSVEANVSTTADVHFDMLSRPVDGIAGKLDLDKLSKPIYDVVSPQSASISTHDEVSLAAEIVRPDIEDPVPVIVTTRLAGQAQVAQQGPALGQLTDFSSFAQEMAARGYAVVTVDVRGTGQSGGCLDVHGILEQNDQASILSWVKEQAWASDKIGTFGIGYSASTALEAAIQAPEDVSAVVSFGAVTDVYRDWHFGGVPNGEGQVDPVTGQLTGTLGSLGVQDPTTALLGATSGGCSGEAFTAATDPRAVYDAAYEVRNLTQKAGDIQAPTLHAQGTFDLAAKPSMAEHLVTQLPSQSLSLIGPWADGLPTRADTVTMTLAWFDQYLKGQEIGLEAAVNASASIQTPTGLARDVPAWPPAVPSPTTLYPGFDAGELAQAPAEGSASITLDPAGASAEASQEEGQTLIRLEKTIQQPTYLSGSPDIRLAASLAGLGNAYVSAELYEVDASGEKDLISFGMANLAHHTGHGSYVPVEPGQLVKMVLPMQPTERLLKEDTKIVLEIRSATVQDGSFIAGALPGQLTLEGGASGMLMVLPTAASGSLTAAANTIVPAPSVPVPG